jgi:hypothetical protein
MPRTNTPAYFVVNTNCEVKYIYGACQVNSLPKEKGKRCSLFSDGDEKGFMRSPPGNEKNDFKM